jgi:hypothetical protein
MATPESTPTNDPIDTEYVETGDGFIMNPRNQIWGDDSDLILDKDWAKSAFLVSDANLRKYGAMVANIDVKNRYRSSASWKFVDSRLGGNIGINPRPQFTRYSDIRVKGRRPDVQDVSLTSTEGPFGIGRYYSEAIDDTKQVIYMRFGVPKYKGLLSYFMGAYDARAQKIARTGRTSIFYDAGYVAGSIAVFLAHPWIYLSVKAFQFVDYLVGQPSHKYYTLKPTMPMYWSTVHTLVRNLAVNRGILPSFLNQGAEDKGKKVGRDLTIDEEHLQMLSMLMPDIFQSGTNLFLMHSIANRAQRIANNLYDEEFEKLDKSTNTNFEGYVLDNFIGQTKHATNMTDADGNVTWAAAFERLAHNASLETLIAKLKGQSGLWSGGDNDAMEKDLRVTPNTAAPPDSTKKTEQQAEPSAASEAEAEMKLAEENDRKTFWTDFKNNLEAEFADGSQFATFIVDHTGSMSESFSNSYVESEISNKLNGMSSNARSVRFAFAEGNVIGGALGDMLGSAIGAVTDVVEGAADGATMGFSGLIKGLLGSGYLDIPKHWQSSTANLPRGNYTIQLISPYGNAISQLQNIYIPLAMLMAGALPLSTGGSSFAAPMLCELYDQGRLQTRLGAIESLSISRGTSNLAFNQSGNAMAIDVSFTVIDLSSILSMPVSDGGIFSPDVSVDSDNTLMDYLAVLAGQDLNSQRYLLPRGRLRLAKMYQKYATVASPGYWAMQAKDGLDAIGIGHVIGGMARNSGMVQNAFQL